MMQKEDLLKLLKKELATTLKVMEAFPSDQVKFKPHEKSSDALKLMRTFVFESYLTTAYVFGEPLDREKFKTYNPQELKVLIEDFKTEITKTITRLETLPEEDLKKVVEFAGTKFSAGDYLLMMICDQIHHRGQLTVYVRIAGGSVPSIYGPSADDTSTNL